MSDVAMQTVLDASAKGGKRLGVGESTGRIWGFLLLKTRPVTQKEIEACTGLSRGMISQCLQGTQSGLFRLSKKGRRTYSFLKEKKEEKKEGDSDRQD